jgi:hypothetical protein
LSEAIVGKEKKSSLRMVTNWCQRKSRWLVGMCLRTIKSSTSRIGTKWRAEYLCSFQTVDIENGQNIDR